MRRMCEISTPGTHTPDETELVNAVLHLTGPNAKTDQAKLVQVAEALANSENWEPRLLVVFRFSTSVEDGQGTQPSTQSSILLEGGAAGMTRRRHDTRLVAFSYEPKQGRMTAWRTTDDDQLTRLRYIAVAVEPSM